MDLPPIRRDDPEFPPTSSSKDTRIDRQSLFPEASDLPPSKSTSNTDTKVPEATKKQLLSKVSSLGLPAVFKGEENVNDFYQMFARLLIQYGFGKSK